MQNVIVTLTYKTGKSVSKEFPDRNAAIDWATEQHGSSFKISPVSFNGTKLQVPATSSIPYWAVPTLRA